MSVEGEKNMTDNVTVAKAKVLTLSSVICPLPLVERDARKRELTSDFIHGFDLSLSNDGANFGSQKSMLVFNSTCQTPSVVDGKTIFELKVSICIDVGVIFFLYTILLDVQLTNFVDNYLAMGHVCQV